MADGVAHQVKNRLNHFSVGAGEMQFEIEDFKKNHTDLLKTHPELNKTMGYLLQIAQSLLVNVKRTDDIVKGILNYTRTESKETFYSEFSLKEIITVSCGLLTIKHEIAEIPLEIDVGRNDTLYGVKSQIIECIYNLLDNGYEAILEKTAQLPTKERENFRGKLKISLSQKPNVSEITIEDNGLGIKEENVRKIFAPFFTTKSSYKSGTGIGIYVVKRIIEENHKGRIWFDTVYGEGTTIHVELPRQATRGGGNLSAQKT